MKKFQVAFVALSLITVSLGVTSCNLFQKQAVKYDQQQLNPDQAEKRISEIKQMGDMITNLGFDESRVAIEKSLKNSAKVIPSLASKDETSQIMVKTNIDTIENAATEVMKSDSPESVIINTEAGLDSTVSALRTLGEQSELKISDLDQRLNNVEMMSKNMNSENYQENLGKAFTEISSIMNEMNNAKIARQQEGQKEEKEPIS